MINRVQHQLLMLARNIANAQRSPLRPTQRLHWLASDMKREHGMREGRATCKKPERGLLWCAADIKSQVKQLTDAAKWLDAYFQSLREQSQHPDVPAYEQVRRAHPRHPAQHVH